MPTQKMVFRVGIARGRGQLNEGNEWTSVDHFITSPSLLLFLHSYLPRSVPCFNWKKLILPVLSLSLLLCCAAKADSSSEHVFERLFMDSSMKPNNITQCVCVCECVNDSERRKKGGEIKRGKGILGARLQYHLYANLLRLW